MSQKRNTLSATTTRRRSGHRKYWANDPSNPKFIAAQEKRKRRRVRNMKQERNMAWAKLPHNMVRV